MRKENLTFDDSARLFIESTYQLSEFDSKYQFLILEHAVDLFTPKQMLLDIKNKLKTETSIVYYNGKEIQQFLDKKEKAKFKEFYGNDYDLYVLYCDPVNEIEKFSWKHRDSIKSFFLQNKNCPAARFYSKNLSIIILNSNVISINDNGNELELQLDHELNHVFDKLSDKKYSDLNNELQKEIIQYFNDLNILSYDVKSIDFSIHMFNSSEFYEMLSNLCNVISLYFEEKDKFEIYKKLMNMLTEQYLKSDEFQQLEEPIQGSIIFAYICKKYSKERWNRAIIAVKKQLDLTNFSDSLKISLLNLKRNFLNLFK